MEYPEQKQNDSVELDGKIFKHKKGTSSFYNVDNENETLGFMALLKRLSPETYRSKSMKYQAPEELLLLGAASRVRVMRAVQLHYYKPNETPYVLNTLMPLLAYMTDKADCGNGYEVQSQFKACRWAVNQKYASYNDLFAAALFNDVGVAPDFSEIEMKGTSSHKITATKDGIIIEITSKYPITERIPFGLEKLENEINRYNRIGQSKPSDFIVSLAMQAFYTCGDDYRISLKGGLHWGIQSFYYKYLNSRKKGIDCIKTPSFESPFDMLEPQTIILPYDAFIKEGISDAEWAQRKRNAYNANYEATMQKALKLPKKQNLFTYQQLKDVDLMDRRLQSAKENGIIDNFDRGMYRFASDFWQELCFDNAEEDNY